MKHIKNFFNGRLWDTAIPRWFWEFTTMWRKIEQRNRWKSLILCGLRPFEFTTNLRQISGFLCGFMRLYAKSTGRKSQKTEKNCWKLLKYPLYNCKLCAILDTMKKDVLQGGVKVPTGGKPAYDRISPRAVRQDPVRFRGRQYSLDGRRRYIVYGKWDNRFISLYDVRKIVL